MWQRNITKMSSTHFIETLVKISGAHSENHYVSKWHKNVLVRVGPNGAPIATPSVCLYMIWSKITKNSYATKSKDCFVSLWSYLWIMLVSQKKSSKQMSTSSFQGILLNKLSALRLAVKWKKLKLPLKHPNIKLTWELEKNDSFSLLNVKITCSNNQLVTSAFRKATFNGAFTSFKSFLSVAYKFGLVYTLLHDSISICSIFDMLLDCHKASFDNFSILLKEANAFKLQLKE